MKQEPKYRVDVNGAFQFDMENGQENNSLDLIDFDSGQFHILHDEKSFTAKLISTDFENKIFHIRINGNPYHIRVFDQFDQLVDRLGLSAVVSNKVKDIKAPMPGLVLDVNVSAGQEVNKGDKLVILEAMKMENVIKSEGEGVVKEVHVEKGATVDKGQMLIEMA